MCGFPLSFSSSLSFFHYSFKLIQIQKARVWSFSIHFLPFSSLSLGQTLNLNEFVMESFAASLARIFCVHSFSSESFCSFFISLEWTISNFRDGTAADSEQTQTNSIGKCLVNLNFILLLVCLSRYQFSSSPVYLSFHITYIHSWINKKDNTNCLKLLRWKIPNKQLDFAIRWHFRNICEVL